MHRRLNGLTTIRGGINRPGADNEVTLVACEYKTRLELCVVSRWLFPTKQSCNSVNKNTKEQLMTFARGMTSMFRIVPQCSAMFRNVSVVRSSLNQIETNGRNCHNC